jgi:hypothetical protein
MLAYPGYGATLMPPLGSDNFYDAIVGLLSPVIRMTADYAVMIPLPFARYVELGDTYTYFTRASYDPQARQVITDSQFQLSVFATNREQARQIGRQIMNMLDDYKPTYRDGRVMYLEPVAAIFIPEPHTGPSTATVFHRAITFALTEQRGI